MVRVLKGDRNVPKLQCTAHLRQNHDYFGRRDLGCNDMYIAIVSLSATTLSTRTTVEYPQCST